MTGSTEYACRRSLKKSFSTGKASRMYDAFQCLADLRMLKHEAALQKPAGQNPLAFENDGPEFSQYEPDHEPGGRDKRRPMQGLSKSLCKVLIPHRIWRADVHRSG